MISTSLIIAFDGLLPEVTDTGITILPEAHVDQKIAETIVRLKVWRCLRGSPLLDGPSAGRCTVPTAQLASALGFVIEGSSKRYYSLDLPHRN